ncbi:adenylate/guanylate cyclase domain-containing protein [Oceanibacterium hippocampi]|uniref:Adenylate cyclase 1 n=1 Tax=Oceanibacterium hippocampi TaxID=745714 RepID=A0A1Y5RB91_9PROT|nr:adenylate/guanylate cyclase domain-containing protein [Oceanibacterium hippocampi]SLN10879.1 Adenylate cyclase 1 [Oceanibacterium hippocampi]
MQTDIYNKAQADDGPEVAGNTGRPERRFRIGLQSSLILVVLVTVALAAAAVHIPWQYTARQNVADIARQLNGEIIGGIKSEVQGLFAEAESAQTTLHDLLAKGTVDIEDPRRRRELFLSFLEASSHFSWVSFGYPDGGFFGAQRRDNVNFRVATSRWDPAREQAFRQTDFYVRDGHELYFTQTKDATNDYYSPDREWYKLATATSGPIWTDVYVFASSGKPGINTALALDIDGEFAGVVSIAIELERLSLYLKTISVGEHGTAFIMNGEGELIAFPDTDEVLSQAGDGERAALRTLGSSWQPLLRIASAALQSGHVPLASLRETRQTTYRDPASGDDYFVTFAPVGHGDWLIGTVVPESDFLTRVNENTRKLIYALAAAIAIVALAAILVSQLLFVRPLNRMIGQASRVERFELDAVSEERSIVSEIDRLSAAIYQMSRGLGSFRKYLPTELVRQLTARGILAEPGGERKTLTIMFSDLAGFTELTERMGHRILPHLADYLTAMSREIAVNRGTIDKYIGDAIMAFWGAPRPDDEHAVAACRAALNCQRLLEVMRIEWAREGRPEFRARIGINSGRVIVGNIGSQEKLDYTVVGDPVNLAARLEGLNKDYGTEIMIGPATYEIAKYDIIARKLDHVAVKGREEVQAVYELLAMQDTVSPTADFGWITVYEQGLEQMRNRRYKPAIEHFQTVIELRGGSDRPSTEMIRRCRERIACETLTDKETGAAAQSETVVAGLPAKIAGGAGSIRSAI